MNSFKTILPIGIGQYLFLLVALSVSSCVDDHMNIESSLDGMLQIHVVTNHVETKDAIFDSYLPDKSVVGVWLTDSKGDSYITSSNETFELYTAEGEGMSQSWYSHRKIALDERTATVYASYPGAEADGILSIKSDQTDYMYATPTTVSRSNPFASLVMNHALSIIEFSCVKSSVYSGAGTINSFRISSPVIASSGELDVKTGIISDFGDAFPVELPVSDLTLSDVPAVGHIIVIPRGVSGVLTLSVKVDNVWHSVKTNPITLEQGKKYHYDLSIGREYVQVGKVQVTDWVDNHVGDETIEYGNFKINITGDKNNLAFSHSVSNGIVTIKAVSLLFGASPSQITCSNATVEQTVVDGLLTANISNINSDIEIEFYGSTPYTGLEDGVYAVDEEWNPVRPGEENESNIGVMLVNKTNMQRFFIEKYEVDNPIYGEITQGYIDNRFFYWGEKGVDQSLIQNKTTVEEAIADFQGKTWSNVLVKSGNTGSSEATSYATIGSLLERFIYTKYLGKDEWYIPAYGQLSLIYVNEDAINTLLSKIGGYLFDGYGYWSSTEYDANQAWVFSYDRKDSWYKVRLIVDL